MNIGFTNIVASSANTSVTFDVDGSTACPHLSGLPQVFYDFGRVVTWNPAAPDVDPA